MVIKKRQLLWDWTNSSGPGNPGVPQEMNSVPFGGNSPMASVINWNARVPPELKGRAPFRPMVRGMGQVNGSDWSIIENTSFHIILFFNEPERAGISPEQARDIWYSKMLPLRRSKAKKLGSPAVANDANGQKWLEKWMDLVAKDPPDYVCLHYYSHSADEAKKYITSMHNKYPKHEIMVTEIACTDRNYENVLNFTIEMCNWMDDTSFVFEYGLFDFQRRVADQFVSPAAQLMEPSGHFTQLGNMYLHDQPMRHPAKTHPPATLREESDSNPLRAPTPPIHDSDGVGHHEDGPIEGVLPEDEEELIIPSSEPEQSTLLTTSTEDQASTLIIDQSAALKIQNDGRHSKNLHPLSWDNNLAAHAQAWANHLAQIGKLEHSPNSQRSNEGENLAWAIASGGVHDPLTGAAKMWMNEARNYHGEIIPQGDFSKYGHYTQCMWKSTARVGMAFARDAKGGAYTVGRYAPPGNITGQKPF